MRTDTILVSSSGDQMEKAFNEADKVSVYKDLSPKSRLHLRLLTEEMMGMMRSITGENEGSFWIEDQDGKFELHLRVQTQMNTTKREKLLSTSTTGKNESAKGIMGRIRDFFDRGADSDIAAYSSPLILPSMMERASSSTLDWEWSMVQYANELAPHVESKEKDAIEAWDEMEKSVVSHVADDVKVSIHNNIAELIIEKKMA